MKKLTMLLRGHHILLLLPLTLFTYTLSYTQTIIIGNASGDINKLPAGRSFTANVPLIVIGRLPLTSDL